MARRAAHKICSLSIFVSMANESWSPSPTLTVNQSEFFDQLRIADLGVTLAAGESNRNYN